MPGVATGLGGALGFGPETTWATGVAPSYWLDQGTEGLQASVGQLRPSFLFGRGSLGKADPGRKNFSGSVETEYVRTNMLYHFLRAVMGAPTTTGASAPYTHVFTDAFTSFSDDCPLPPYTVYRRLRDDLVERFLGCNFGSLSLDQSADGLLTASIGDIVAKDMATYATPLVITSDTSPQLRYEQLAVKRNATAFNYAMSLSFEITNDLEGIETFNQSRLINGIVRNSYGLSGELTTLMRGDVDAIRADFTDSVSQAWEFEWVADAGNSLKLEIPALGFEEESFQANIAGPEMIEVTVGFIAQFDPIAGFGFKATLKNGINA